MRSLKPARSPFRAFDIGLHTFQSEPEGVVRCVRPGYPRAEFSDTLNRANFNVTTASAYARVQSLRTTDEQFGGPVYKVEVRK